MTPDVRTGLEDCEVMIPVEHMRRRHPRNARSDNGELHDCFTILAQRPMYQRLGSRVRNLKSRLNRRGK